MSQLCEHYPELVHPAEDWAQEAFYRAIKEKDKFVLHENQYGWLRVACRHQADNAIQRQGIRKRRTLFALDAPNAPDVEDAGARMESWEQRQEALEKVNRVINVLSASELQIAQDVFLCGMKEREAAKKRSKPLSAVKAAIRRIRMKSKKFLEGILLVLNSY